MAQSITVVSSTSNQSNAVYRQKKIFIWNNFYTEGVYTNSSGAPVDISPGQLMLRDTAVTNGFKPAIAGATLADLIGVSAVEEVTTVANGATIVMNVCTEGGIDGTQLVFPAAVTLATVVGNKTVKDIINALGIHIDDSAVENTKVDNQ